MTGRPDYARGWAAASLASLAASLAVIVLDLATSVWPKAGFGALAESASVVLALFWPLALGAWVFGVLAWLAASELVGARARRWRDAIRDDRDADRRAAAALLATLLGLATLGLWSAVFGLILIANVERTIVGAALLVVVVPVGLLPALGVGMLSFRGLAPLAQKLTFGPRRLTVWTLLTLAGLGILLPVLVVVTRLDWRALPWTLAAYLALWFVLGAALSWAFYRQKLPGAPRRTALFSLLACLALLAAAKRVPFGAEAASAVQSESALGSRVLALGRRFFDGDGDGFSAAFAGGDCDDTSARIHPGAEDVPDNGVDENCSGLDATATAHKTPKATQPARVEFHGNVVVIVVDTVRADRLGFAGYRRNGKSLTPRLDRLAETAVVFDNVYAQAPNTPRSFPSLFFSRFPSHLDWQNSNANYPVVEPDNESLFEVLAKAGYHTAGVSSHFYFTVERGIRQGFGDYDNEGAKSIADSNHDIAGPRVVAKTRARLATLANAGKPFVLFVHLFEPHSTYVTHPDFPVKNTGLAGLEEKYDYEVAMADRFVGQVLDEIQALGLGEKTMLVVASDHGEAFGEHRFEGRKMYFHGQTLYDELLRVPLFFVIPGVPARHVATPVMLVDLAPTVLNVLGLSIPDAWDGQSLAPLLTGDPFAARPVVAELLPAPNWNHEAKILRAGTYKLYHFVETNEFQLYDLEADAKEQTNLYFARPDLAAGLKAKLARFAESGQLEPDSP